MPDPLIPKSSPPWLVAICQNPHGDGLWFEVEVGRERCPEPGCDCSPARYVLAAEPTDEMVERGARALEHWADAWGQPARREAAARAVLVAALSTERVEGEGGSDA